MEMPRRLINLIGTAVVAAIILGSSLLVMLPLFGAAQEAVLQTKQASALNQTTRVKLDQLAAQDADLPELTRQLDILRTQLTADDELQGASALASSAAKSSGARIVSIAFGERQVFAPPSGAGIGADGKPLVPQTAAKPDTVQVQIPVTIEAEVSSPDRAAAFIDGLRAGPRLLQVVQATSSPTNDTKRLIVTVDALVFSANG